MRANNECYIVLHVAHSWRDCWVHSRGLHYSIQWVREVFL